MFEDVETLAVHQRMICENDDQIVGIGFDQRFDFPVDLFDLGADRVMPGSVTVNQRIRLRPVAIAEMRVRIFHQVIRANKKIVETDRGAVSDRNRIKRFAMNRTVLSDLIENRNVRAVRLRQKRSLHFHAGNRFDVGEHFHDDVRSLEILLPAQITGLVGILRGKQGVRRRDGRRRENRRNLESNVFSEKIPRVQMLLDYRGSHSVKKHQNHFVVFLPVEDRVECGEGGIEVRSGKIRQQGIGEIH